MVFKNISLSIQFSTTDFTSLFSDSLNKLEKDLIFETSEISSFVFNPSLKYSSLLDSPSLFTGQTSLYKFPPPPSKC